MERDRENKMMGKGKNRKGGGIETNVFKDGKGKAKSQLLFQTTPQAPNKLSLNSFYILTVPMPRLLCRLQELQAYLVYSVLFLITWIQFLGHPNKTSHRIFFPQIYLNPLKNNEHTWRRNIPTIDYCLNYSVAFLEPA